MQFECSKVTPSVWINWQAVFLDKFCPCEDISLQKENFILQLQASMMEANIPNY